MSRKKLWIPAAFLVLIGCKQKLDVEGMWYSQNGLLEIEIRTDYTYSTATIFDTMPESGRWNQEGNNIFLDDSDTLEIRSGKLFLWGEALSRDKPVTSTKFGSGFAGNSFYWINGGDTVVSTYSDSTYIISNSEKTFNYQLVYWNGNLYYSDNNPFDIGNVYLLVLVDDGKKIVLERHDYWDREHYVIEFQKF